MGYWCQFWDRTGFYFQGRMDIDPRSWWHNRDFVAANGGYLMPGDTVNRKVLSLDPWDTTRRDMIILLLKDLVERKIPGDMAEVGVYRGFSARLIHHYVPDRNLYLFDTFAGFDQRDIKAEKTATGREEKTLSFSQTGVERALKNIAPQNKNVQVFPGYFPESVPEFLAVAKFAFVHLDADLYEPMMAGLNYFYHKISPGGFILAHDYNSWPGSRKAVREFFSNKPELPIPMPDKSGSALIVKLPTQ
jgi:O-methyltransferase